MNIVFTFKNFEASEHLKGYANKRFGKISRYVSKDPSAELALTMSVDKHRQKAEALLTGTGGSISASSESSDMYASVDMLLDKMEEQIKRGKEKKRSNRNAPRDIVDIAPNLASFATRDEEGEKMLVQSNDASRKPMFLEDAERYLEDTNQEIVVFLNAETQRPTVMYRNAKGKIRVIDPEHD